MLHAIPDHVLSGTFKTAFVSRSESNWVDQIIEKLNCDGLATFDGVTSTAEFLEFAACFGEVRVHPQTDQHGITTMTTSDKYHIQSGIVETPFAKEQLFHTDGSKMVDPPGVVAIYCEAPDPNTPRVNVFAHGGTLFERLVEENPNLLEVLRQPIDFGEFRSPVFTTREDGLTSVRFRQAPEPPKMDLPDEVRFAVDARLRQPDLLLGVTLSQGQGVIFNNHIMLHGLGRSFGIGRVAKRVQLTTGPDSPIKAGFRLQA